MIARGELETEIETDSAPLHLMVKEILEEAECTSTVDAIHCLRDPTRGGLATTLNEIALVAEAVVAHMRQNPYGQDAHIIGEVKTEPQGIVAMRTGFGGTRIVDMLVGEQLPRIC